MLVILWKRVASLWCMSGMPLSLYFVQRSQSIKLHLLEMHGCFLLGGQCYMCQLLQTGRIWRLADQYLFKMPFLLLLMLCSN